MDLSPDAKRAFLLIVTTRDHPDSDWNWDDSHAKEKSYTITEEMNYYPAGTLAELVEAGLIVMNPRVKHHGMQNWSLTELGKRAYLMLK